MPAPALPLAFALGLALPMLTLAACSDGPASAPQTAPQSRADVDRWAASGEALGPIAAGTHFDRATLAALLPDYTVSLGRIERAGNTEPVIEARRDGRQVDLAFFGGESGERIGSIHIREPGLLAGSASLGDRVGDTPLIAANCFAGQDALTGDVVCTDPQAGSLAYWISGDFQPGEMPVASALANGEIYEIVWMPRQQLPLPPPGAAS